MVFQFFPTLLAVFDSLSSDVSRVFAVIGVSFGGLLAAMLVTGFVYRVFFEGIFK